MGRDSCSGGTRARDRAKDEEVRNTRDRRGLNHDVGFIIPSANPDTGTGIPIRVYRCPTTATTVGLVQLQPPSGLYAVRIAICGFWDETALGA